MASSSSDLNGTSAPPLPPRPVKPYHNHNYNTNHPKGVLRRAETVDATTSSLLRNQLAQAKALRKSQSTIVDDRGTNAYRHGAEFCDASLRSSAFCHRSRVLFPETDHVMDDSSSDKLDKEITRAVKVVQTFFNPRLLQDQSIPEELLVEAYGLCFLTVYKVGFMFSGKIGNGFVISRTPNGWSAPSFLVSGGFGFGMMAGGERVDYMIILNSRAAVKVFTRNGQFQVGSELDLALGPIGRAASACVNVGRGGIAPNYSYSHSVGLYGGIGLSSALICTRKSLNARCYGSTVTARQILGGEVPCKLAVPLWKALDDALGVRREYVNGFPSAMPTSITCDTCGFKNSSFAQACQRCQSLLVYSVSVHSGRRQTSELVRTELEIPNGSTSTSSSSQTAAATSAAAVATCAV